MCLYIKNKNYASATPSTPAARLGLILDHALGRIGLLGHLTEAMGQARYAQAILLLVKNILIERNALYAIQEWAAQYDPALVYGGYSGDVLARALDRLFLPHLLARRATGSIEIQSIRQGTTK